MASINSARNIITTTLRNTTSVNFILMGVPGVGKSHLTAQIGQAYLEERGIDDSSRSLSVPVSGFDVVDLNGVPSVEEGYTKMNPTEMFYRFREGTGPGVIRLEELAQSNNDMQTWASNFIEERQTPMFKLDPEVIILATGNRTEDRAGARKILSHLADRLTFIDIDTSLDDWCEWAMDNGVEALGIAFMRLRPELLNAFDPEARCCPTQRSWTKVFTQFPTDLPTNEYLELCAGQVGEGAAAEWVAARDMMQKMPSIDVVRMQPDKAEVPEEPAVKFAISTALSMSAKVESFERDLTYMGRLPTEFQMVYVSDVARREPGVVQTKAFIKWVSAHQDIFMPGSS